MPGYGLEFGGECVDLAGERHRSDLLVLGVHGDDRPLPDGGVFGGALVRGRWPVVFF